MLDTDLVPVFARLPERFIRQSNFKDPRQKGSFFTYFIDCFSKIIPEGENARVDPRADTVRQKLSLVLSCLEISDRTKYAGWNDLDDLHDLDGRHANDTQTRRHLLLLRASGIDATFPVFLPGFAHRCAVSLGLTVRSK